MYVSRFSTSQKEQVLSSTHVSPPRGEYGLLALLMSSVVILVTTMGMLGPLLVDLAAAFQISIAQAGQLATITALPWAITSLFTGWLADRYGRKPLLTGSLFGIGFCCAFAAFATNFPMLVVLRILTGIVGGAGPVALMAVVGDQFPPERRGMALGWINAGFGVSAVAGVPLVAAIGGAWGWRWSFATIAGVALLLGSLLWRWLPTDIPHRRNAGSLFYFYRTALSLPRIGYLLGANLLERIIFAGITFYWAAFLIETFHLSTLTVAPILTLVALGTISGNLVGGWLADRVSRPLLFMIAQSITGLLGVSLLGWPVWLGVSTAGGILLTFANALSRPGFMAMAVGLSEQNRGTTLGLFTFTNQMGWTLGAAMGGAAIALGGYPALGTLMLLLSSAAVGIIFPFGSRYKESHT